MTDSELINEVARIWVDAGGDAEGIDWNVQNIKDAINIEIENRIMQEQEQQEINEVSITREMAIDAGDLSLEGQKTCW